MPDPKCFASHMGYWCVAPFWFDAQLAAYRHGLLIDFEAARGAPASEPMSYELLSNVAVINANGYIMKGQPKFGGFSTIGLQRVLAQADRDPEVKGKLILMDSPGGGVSGVNEAGKSIAASNSVKPIVVHADDLLASAAYWLASAAHKIFASEATQVGSIGVIARVEDTSRAMEAQGVKVEYITSDGADAKMLGADGIPVTDAARAEILRMANSYADLFIGAIQRGRGMSGKSAKAVADGRLHMAAQSQELGLIDGVQDQNASMLALQKEINRRDARQNAEKMAMRRSR